MLFVIFGFDLSIYALNHSFKLVNVINSTGHILLSEAVHYARTQSNPDATKCVQISTLRLLMGSLYKAYKLMHYREVIFFHTFFL